MFSIDKIKVGENYPPVVIAEIGINHNGNLDLAIELADSAIKSGIEIIKHQTHIIEDEMSLEAKKVVPGNSKQSIFDIIKKNSLTEKQEIKKFTKYIKIKKKYLLAHPSLEQLQID